MYLQVTDVIAVFIALVSSVTLVITTAIANARITRSRNDWRTAYLQLADITKHCACAECD